MVQRATWEDYWARDFPLLDGRVRFVVVLGLALTGWSHFSIVMPTRLLTCPEGFYEPMGLMKWVPLGENPGVAAGALLEQLAPVLMILLAAGALGLGNGWAMLAAGLLLAAFVGLHRSCTGTGHMWYLPMYTLITLGATCCSDAWSIDAWLSKRLKNYPLYQPGGRGLRSSGLGPKLVLLFSVFMLFSAGVAKLAEAGPVWATGESLQGYLGLIGAPKPWGTWLFDLLLESDTVAMLAAVFTLLLELGSVVMLFVRRSRLPYVIAAWGFHLGIMAVMLPEYLPQMLCYLVIWDVRSWTQKALRKRKNLNRKARRSAGLIGVAAVTLLTVTMALRIDSFPLTHVPMYSSRLGRGYVAGQPASDWDDPQKIQRIAQEITKNGRPWIAKFGLTRFLQVYALHSPQDPPALATPTLARQIAPGDPALWSSRLTHAAAGDLATEPLTPGSRTPLVVGGTSEKFLANIAAQMAKKTDEPPPAVLALVYVFPNGTASVIGRLRLD